MTNDLFHIVENLNTEAIIPSDGKTIKVVFQDEHLKAVLFGFASGAGLLEHSTPMPGILYFVKGEAKVSLGDQHQDATAGMWIHMTPNLPHSIQATTDTVMLLLALKCGKPTETK